MRKLVLLFVFTIGCNLFTLNGLVLNRVILASNNNDQYIQFWPIVAPLWEQMGFRPTLALIADENCNVDTEIGDVIRFKPIPGVSESLHAQSIRLLLPVLFPDDNCLISDIDMLPISRSYFVDGAAPCPENAFLVYRDGAYSKNEKKYPMCYFGGKGRVFTSVFGVSTKPEIRRLIRKWSKLGHGWNTDEIMLYQYVNDWEQKGGNVFRLGHGVGPRLDRLYWNEQTKDLEISRYIDCHCPRPYIINKQSIDAIVQAITKYNAMKKSKSIKLTRKRL